MLAPASPTTYLLLLLPETMASRLDELLGGQDLMLPILAESMHQDWKMFSYDHWWQRANADNTKQMVCGRGNEARGDGGTLRIRR